MKTSSLTKVIAIALFVTSVGCTRNNESQTDRTINANPSTGANAPIDTTATPQPADPNNVGRDVSTTPVDSAGASASAADASVDKQTIMEAQRALIGRGHDLEADGVMNTKTSNAVKQFQKEQQLEETGRLNDRTLRALNVTSDEDRSPASVNDKGAAAAPTAPNHTSSTPSQHRTPDNAATNTGAKSIGTGSAEATETKK